MASKSYSEITSDGLWGNNPALVQLLGLCPLLAVTGSVVNALGLGLMGYAYSRQPRETTVQGG